MREIKFRAWDKDARKWVLPPSSLYMEEFSHEYATKSLPFFPETGFEFTPHSPVVWMQFTGLVDRHGREIYEGDIVHIPEITNVKGMHNADDPYHASIGFNNGGFTFDMIGWGEGGNPEVGGGYLHTHISSICEVVGNIYENPTLLEEK